MIYSPCWYWKVHPSTGYIPLGFCKTRTRTCQNPHLWMRVWVLMGTGVGCPGKPQGSPWHSLAVHPALVMSCQPLCAHCVIPTFAVSCHSWQLSFGPTGACQPWWHGTCTLCFVVVSECGWVGLGVLTSVPCYWFIIIINDSGQSSLTVGGGGHHPHTIDGGCWWVAMVVFGHWQWQ